MTERNPADDKKIWISIFRRKGGGEGYAHEFETMPQAAKALILDQVDLCSGELPVLAGLADQENFFLLTTRRLISRRGRDFAHIETGNIASVGFSDEVKSDPNKKNVVTSIEIEDAFSGKHCVDMRHQTDKFSIMSVMLNIARRNRSAGR